MIIVKVSQVKTGAGDPKVAKNFRERVADLRSPAAFVLSRLLGKIPVALMP
jgi:hypothetical protein